MTSCLRFSTASLTLSLLLLTSSAFAQGAIEHALAIGQGAPWLGRGRVGSAEVLVRFDRAVPVDAVRELENHGVTLPSAAGRPLVWREWALLRVDARGVRALEGLEGVREVRVAPGPGLPPLDRSAGRLGLEAARGAGGVNERWTGEGVLVADLDSHVDVFHPDFFFADAGWYDWLDVNGDGVFTPGVDAIDLDRDGEVDEGERARVLRATPIDVYDNDTSSLTARIFDPAVDWVYADLDGDSARGFGAAQGFTDEDPAFGEPLFVPNDVDGDGQLGLHERLVRLGTSKLRAAMVRIDYPGISPHDHVYTRGVDLASTPNELTGGVHGYADTLHATGVLGILAGGVPLPSRRWVGVAPNAELVNAFDIGSSGSGGILWALDQEPDVLLHEYVSWANVALDGTDVSSAIIDDAAANGIANICPAGNIGGAARHAERMLAAGEETTFILRVPPRIGYIQFSFHGRGDGALSVALLEGGTAHEIGPAPYDVRLAGGGTLYDYEERSPRGTEMRHGVLYMAGEGVFTFRVRATGGPLVVHALSSDENGFGPGAAWDGASDASTIAAPATADRCLAVGSVPSHLSAEGPWYVYPEAEGEVRGYSARGPRIDGELRPHVVAPDNPWSAVGHGDLYPSMPGAFVAPQGGYMVFGGTSGAGPHAAGVAALLAGKGLEGDAILARIRETTIADPIAGELPNDDYGHGRLSAARALGGEASMAPTVTLRAEPAHARPGESVRLVVEVADPEGGVVEVRWDDDYDGGWDTAYGPPDTRMVAFPQEGVYRWRVRARDDAGWIADAAVRLVVSETPAPMPDAGMQLGDGGMAGDSGGCGCHVTGRSSALGLASLPLAWLVLRLRRRSRTA